METEQAVVRPSRDEMFDVAKGVGIVAVVALHLSNRSARYFHQPFSGGWWSLTWLNLFVNFCVPLFLLISAILLARSASKQEKPDWGRFAVKRLRSVLLPLFVWSIIYWLLRVVIQHDSKVSGSAYWLSPRPLVDLLLGKAEFHLYFLSVLAQVCLILPLVFMLYRRVRFNLWAALLFAITMQGAAYLIHKAIPYEAPGSIVLWYLSTVLPGIWIGMNWGDWPQIRRISWPVWVVLALGGLGVLVYETTLQLQKQPIDGNLLNLAPFVYGLGGPVLILSLLSIWTRGAEPVRGVLKRLGEMSLQIYLMHPILLELLSRPTLLNVFKALPLPSLWFFLVTLGGTYLISVLLEKIGVLNPVLFGRDASR